MANKRRKVDVESQDMDLTSMIDVCFLLIAFFIMVTEVSKAEVIEIYLPDASYAIEDKTPPPDRLIVNIDTRGSMHIRSQEYAEVATDEDARKKLAIDLQGYSEDAGIDPDTKTSNMTVLVRADGHVPYQYVQVIMMMLADPKVNVQKINYSAKNPNQPQEG